MAAKNGPKKKYPDKLRISYKKEVLFKET